MLNGILLHIYVFGIHNIHVKQNCFPMLITNMNTMCDTKCTLHKYISHRMVYKLKYGSRNFFKDGWCITWATQATSMRNCIALLYQSLPDWRVFEYIFHILLCNCIILCGNFARESGWGPPYSQLVTINMLVKANFESYVPQR